MLRYWRPGTGNYHFARPGIEVTVRDDAFQDADGNGFRNTFADEVRYALGLLNRTVAGNTLLAALSASPRITNISPSAIGANTAQMLGPPHALNLVASELYAGLPGVNTRNAVQAVFGAGLGGATALAAAINATPEWRLLGVPGVGGGFYGNMQRVRDYLNSWLLLADPRYLRWSDTNEGYSRWFRPFGVQGNNVGATGALINHWLQGNALQAPLNTPDATRHVKRSTIAATYAQAPAGPGCNVSVRWESRPGRADNDRRPPPIGLGHELVHAYHGVRGTQPGHEQEVGSPVLFEFLCVGIGPWDFAPVTENALRSQWWHAVSGHLIPGDLLNRKAIPRRIKYD